MDSLVMCVQYPHVVFHRLTASFRYIVRQAKTCKLIELLKTEKDKLTKLNAMLDEFKHGKNVKFKRQKNVLSKSRKNQYNIYVGKKDAISVQ